MVKFGSLFTQVLSLIHRHSFDRAVRQHRAEHGAKGFSCWSQFVAMMFCQLAGANTLREICGGLATATGKLVHLGLKDAPARATLAYANEHRSYRVFEATFYHLFQEAQSRAALKRRKFRFKNPLKSLDSSTIELCLAMYDWAKFRRAKGAVKLHLQLDHQGYLPSWALITNGKTHDVKVAQMLKYAPGTIVAMDRGYVDYGLFGRWSREGVYFVTRAKSNMVYRVVARRPRPERGNVLRDEEIELTGVKAKEACSSRLRRIVVWDAENQRQIVLVTNHLEFAAGTIGRIYKDRWQIELFFKAIKQVLKIKTFVGTSENAVQIQIWTALICMLVLKILQLRSTFGWSVSNLAAMLRMNLLTYRDLWHWLDDPYDTPVAEPVLVQLTLF
jgi:IS4 transposase